MTWWEIYHFHSFYQSCFDEQRDFQLDDVHMLLIVVANNHRLIFDENTD